MKMSTLLLLILVSIDLTGQSTKSGYIKAKSLTIYYEITGNGSPVFLLHAGLQDHSMWDQQLPELSKKHQVITIDLPSHGKTTGSDTTFHMSDVLKAVMDSLKISKASFVGLSFGGVCATEMVLKYPDRVSKVVLAAPGLLGWDKFFKTDDVSKLHLDSLDAAFKSNDTLRQATEFTRVWCIGPFREANDVASPVREYIYTTTLKNLRTHAHDHWPRFAETNAAEKISMIKKPVLIIKADKDLPLIANACNYLVKNIKGSKLVSVPNAAHMLNMEQSRIFNKALIDFL
jgi:3-oxoadipate enol-lactonase